MLTKDHDLTPGSAEWKRREGSFYERLARTVSLGRPRGIAKRTSFDSHYAISRAFSPAPMRGSLQKHGHYSNIVHRETDALTTLHFMFSTRVMQRR